MNAKELAAEFGVSESLINELTTEAVSLMHEAVGVHGMPPSQELAIQCFSVVLNRRIYYTKSILNDPKELRKLAEQVYEVLNETK